MYINSGVKDNPSKYDNSFEANLSIRKNDLPQRIFNIPLSINEMLTVHAEIDDRSNGHELTVDAPSLQYGSNGISGFNMIVSGDGDMPFASVKGSYLSAKGKSATLYGFISGNDNLLNTSIIVWDNDSHSGTPAADLHADVALGPYNRKSGDIRLQTDIRNAYFKFNGRDWKVGNTTIVSDSGRYAIDNLVLSNELQSITIDGAIAADTSHTLSVAFDDICLDDITALLDKKTGLPLAEGYASGTVMASSILDRPIIYGNIETGAISFMGSRIDSLSAVGDWNGERQAVELKLDMLNGESLHTMAQGVYVPKNDSLDIYVRANRLDMYFLNRVIPKNTINEIRSLVTTGNLRICGNMKRLDFIGDAFIEDTYVDVTPNNVTYYVPEAVMNLRPGMFTFSDMDTYDLYGNYGIVDLNIRHTHLKRFMVNLQLQSNGIEVYDMPEKEYSQIYGRIFAGGTPRLSTRSGNVSITGNCMTAPGTWLDIKSGVNNATSYSFLTIKDASVSLEDFYDIREKEAATKKVRKNKSNLEINLNAELTDNAVIYAQMNSVSGSIRGSGNVVFKYDNREISMSGIYNITRGNCVLSLQQILRKEFSLLDNSRVTFNGSIGNTNLDIHASHTVNSVSMYDLDAKANGSSRVRARCLMDVTGTVSSPQLTFNVDAPQASAEDREMIASATSTEEQRNMQFMYLLTLGRFYTYDYSNAASLSANPVSAMQSLLNTTINGQINNLLSYMLNSDYVSLSSNLSTSYLSDDPTSFVDDTFEGILEAHLLNNRLILNGNFGYRKDNLNQTSSVIGDFELKWLLFPKAGISLLGYNRNNQRYYTKTTLYTQGFGVAYQNDFNSFSRKDSLKSEAVEKRKRRRRNQ